jgi:hypothetical protein
VALLGAGAPAGAALQALRAVGKDNVNDTVVRQLCSNLPPDAKSGLRKLRHKAPQWVPPVVAAITAYASLDEQVRVSVGSRSGRRFPSGDDGGIFHGILLHFSVDA